jgi:hypothetical protein
MCCYAECRYAECRYAECSYADCRYAECRGAHQGPSRNNTSFSLQLINGSNKLECCTVGD